MWDNRFFLWDISIPRFLVKAGCRFCQITSAAPAHIDFTMQGFREEPARTLALKVNFAGAVAKFARKNPP
jgi:hypothetical protein